MPSERRFGDNPTANEYLMDRAVRHAVFLERFKAGEVRKILAFLNEELYPDLLGQLLARLERIKVRGFDTGVHSTERLKKMAAALDSLITDRFSQARVRLNGTMVDLARMEAQFQARAISLASPIRFETVVPSAEILRSVVTARPFQGKLLREWWRDQARGTRGLVRQAINVGLAQGDSAQAIVRRVRGVIPTTQRGAESIVRTAVNHVTAHAREATYEANADLVKGWQFVATLDSRTTPTCASLDGKVFDLGTGPKPPRHMGCRSTTTPVLKSWKEMGIGLPEAPEGTRASLSGQVPESLTFGRWLRNQPREVQDEVLGATRGRLFRKGELPIERFVDANQNPLSLDELAARESDAFELAGV